MWRFQSKANSNAFDYKRTLTKAIQIIRHNSTGSGLAFFSSRLDVIFLGVQGRVVFACQQPDTSDSCCKCRLIRHTQCVSVDPVFTVSTHIDWDEAEQAVTFRVDQRYELGEEVFTSYNQGPRSLVLLMTLNGVLKKSVRLWTLIAKECIVWLFFAVLQNQWASKFSNH